MVDHQMALVARAFVNSIMDRVHRSETTALRSIILEETDLLLGRIARDAGWSYWPPSLEEKPGG